MFSILKHTHDPTGIEHSLYCNFFHPLEKNLIVAGGHVLKVYRLICDHDLHKNEDKPPKMKLECVGTYHLFGNIMSMQATRLVGSKRDSLLLSFKEAKLSIVEYDPHSHDLRTLSLHYFEEDEMKEGCTQHYHTPTIRVDPEGRCAVMLVYGKKLVVLPFRREITSDDAQIFPGIQSTVTGRSPVMASYMIKLKELEDRIDNVIDLQFLHGYYEPTLLLLFEPLKTYAGRIAIRQDTCAMVAISINIQQKVHPVIWSVANLPFDCTKALAVPKPIGGTLLFAVNSLLYLNQSVPPYGVSLNSIADGSTNFPLRQQDGVKITLDCSEARFIAQDKLVISLKGGELFVLTLIADGMRSVRKFHFDKAAASVLTTTMCVCDENYLFLGSRLGNSLLLRYIEKESGSKTEDENKSQEQEDPPSKKKRLDTLGDWMASNVSDIRDLDELEVYGAEDKASFDITQYSFDVCDSLLNIGPCGNVSMGEPAFLSEEFSNSADPDVELVATSGYGKNGALSVLQQTVRPQVVTTFELPDVLDMWTVTSNLGDDISQSDESGDKYHSFLILRRKESTMILQTGQEINELDSSGFITQNQTIFAGNIGSKHLIFQVCESSVRLLEGSEQVQQIILDVGSPIVKATLANPYIVAYTADGQVFLFTLNETAFSTKLIYSRVPVGSESDKVITACAYCDLSGMFTVSFPEQLGEEMNDSSEKRSVNETKVNTITEIIKIDDEDELLYGDSTINFSSEVSDSEKSSSGRAQQHYSRFKKRDVKITFWLIISRESGCLEFYSIPDFNLMYKVDHFVQGPQVLADLKDSSCKPQTNILKDDEDVGRLQLKELLVVGMGHKGSRPMMFARVDEDLLMYEVFPYYENPIPNRLLIRLKKVPHHLLLNERKSRSKKRVESDYDLMDSRRKHSCYLRHFKNVAGYSGVFVCGPYPHWLFMTSRGELRLHPMGIDGSIYSFSAFHNVNCPNGFLYFNKKDELRICVLPTHLSYDSNWLVRKVPLRCTPHFLTYHVESKTYCVVTSQAEPSNRIYRFNGDDKELSVESRDERFPFPYVDKFNIHLFSPVSWEAIPNTQMECEEWEHVTCLKTVNLAYEGARSGLKGYVAVGTNYNYGEDITSRGRILIMDIIEVVPEPGQPLTKNKIKMLYAKEQKGPVTAISHVHGFLVAAIGQKVYIWQLKDNDLVGIAFMDMQIYIHQMITVKSLIYVADIYKSVALLRFQEEYRTLSLICKDFRPMEVYAVEYFIDNTQMGFLTSDVERNLTLFMYQPESRESHGGLKLIRKGDIHIGAHINSFFRIRCKMSDPSSDKLHTTSVEKRHITMFATLDGGIGYLLPIPEKTYRRLQMLQNVLNSYIPHIAGLNPRGFRTFKTCRKLLSNQSKSIIDGDLVYTYLHLSHFEKVEVAKKIGTKIDEVIEDLLEIDRYTAHF